MRMPTIIEHDIRNDSGPSIAITALVATIAIVFIVGVALYVLQVYPFNERFAGYTMMSPPVQMFPPVQMNVSGSASSF